MVSYKYDSTTKIYYFEMWPAPTVIRNYLCLYQIQGADLATGETQPQVISDELLMNRSRFHAYEWAEANKGVHPSLAKSNWMALRISTEKEYLKLLHDAQRQDEEIFIQNYATNYLYPAYSGLTFSANYWQSHAPILYY
jgi:hypothetical protein